MGGVILKEETITIRISKEEKEKLEAAAKAHHLKLAQYIRMVALYATEKGSH